MQGLGGINRACGVVRQQWRDFQRDPPIDTICTVKDGAEQISGSGEILECKIEEQLLARLAVPALFQDGGIVRRTVFDSMIKYGRIRGQPRHRQLVDIALQRPVIEHVTSNVIEPEALAEI